MKTIVRLALLLWLAADLSSRAFAETEKGNATRLPPPSPTEFVTMIERIATHGDLRDVPFSEEVFGVRFRSEAGWYERDGEQVLTGVSYHPEGPFFFGKEVLFQYGYYTGMSRLLPEARYLGYMNFINLDNAVCVRWHDVERFEGKYPPLDPIALWPSMGYGYTLFSNRTFTITWSAAFAQKGDESKCIQHFGLQQELRHPPKLNDH